jgi:hypothetical protein
MPDRAADRFDQVTHFDPRPIWEALSAFERDRIGHAALILAYAWVGAEWAEGKREGGFEAAQFAAERAIAEGLPAIAVPAATLAAGELPLPGLGILGVRACRVCGCTDARACDEGCGWTDSPEPLCTACAAAGGPGAAAS